MTIKQCESCKWHHIWRKQTKETCFLCDPNFMKSKVCDAYKYGDFEEVREEYRQKFNTELA